MPKQPGLQPQSSSALSPSPTALPLLATPCKTKRDVTLPFYLFEIFFFFWNIVILLLPQRVCEFPAPLWDGKKCLIPRRKEHKSNSHRTSRGLQMPSLLLTLPPLTWVRADRHELSQDSRPLVLWRSCPLSRWQHWLAPIIALTHRDGGVCQRGIHLHRWMQMPLCAKVSLRKAIHSWQACN